MNNADILILGAGPAGLAAAYELHKAGNSFLIIEKSDTVGGLAKTFQFGNFRTDIGPHRFFSQNKYLYDLIEDLIGDHWRKVERLTRFYVNGKFFLYPIEIRDVLLSIGPYKAFKILFDYIIEKIKGKLMKKVLISFEDFIIAEFGRTLAELNMLNYTEKIWGLPCSEISPDWAKQRIRGLSLMALVKKMFIKFKEGPKTLVDQFYYPDMGTGLIYESIREKISRGGQMVVKTRSYPVKIQYYNNRIFEVIINENGTNQVYNPKFVISSIPITEFVKLMKPKTPNKVLNAVKKLKFRSHVSLFLTLKKSSIFPDQWLYFPDKEIPFGRIMEPKNFSKKLAPNDKTSLLIEFFCWEMDAIWNASKEDLIEISMEWLNKLNFVKRDEVIESFVHKEKYAYPVYNLQYKENLREIKDWLSQFTNLQLIGRAGSFRYNNQDHALEMGILAARSLIDRKKYNIEDIGAEQEYFERGYVM